MMPELPVPRRREKKKKKKKKQKRRESALFSTKLLERERVREFVRRRAHTRNAAKFR